MRQLVALMVFMLACASAKAQTVKLCAAIAAPGCSCSVSAVNIPYGAVSITQISANRDAAGQITLSCSASGQTLIGALGFVMLNVPYRISLGPSANRNLTYGGYTIPYKLYQNSGRTTEWGTQAEGKDLSGTISISISVALLGLLSLNFPLTNATHIPYSRLSPSGAALASGLYSDTVTVTVSY